MKHRSWKQKCKQANIWDHRARDIRDLIQEGKNETFIKSKIGQNKKFMKIFDDIFKTEEKMISHTRPVSLGRLDHNLNRLSNNIEVCVIITLMFLSGRRLIDILRLKLDSNRRCRLCSPRPSLSTYGEKGRLTLVVGKRSRV